jgi:hypothetical protein
MFNTEMIRFDDEVVDRTYTHLGVADHLARVAGALII